MGGPRARVRSVRKAPTLFDQVAQRCTHLPHKPGAALAAQQRSIEPFVLSDMLEERYPDLWRMFLPQLSDRVQQGAHGLLEDPLHQVVFILIIAIERRPAHHRALGNLANGERLEPPLLDQSNERLTRRLLSSGVMLRSLSHLRHFFQIDACLPAPVRLY